jgi:hypothetical protein
MRNAYKILVRKPEEKRLLGRPRFRWEYIIKMDLEKYSGWIWTIFSWLSIGTSGIMS